VVPFGLRGDIYFLRPGTRRLPDFDKLVPVGAIYTPTLNIPPSSFREGFPGVTTRYEWFAIDYNGRFWIEKPGEYRFRLVSDDGSKLFIDGAQVIDNDGAHLPRAKVGAVKLAGGIHKIRVTYFQGPCTSDPCLALILAVEPRGRSSASSVPMSSSRLPIPRTGRPVIPARFWPIPTAAGASWAMPSKARATADLLRLSGWPAGSGSASEIYPQRLRVAVRSPQ
jgi:hypothetical protein